MNKIDKLAKFIDAANHKEPEFRKGFLKFSGADAMKLSLNTKEAGKDGINYEQGIAQNQETNTRYLPVSGRGMSGDPGTYRKLFLSEPTFKSSHDTIVQSITTGEWDVYPHENVPEEDLERAEEISEWVEKALKGIDGGWDKFLTEWADALYYGFTIWETVYNRDGSIKKFAVRRASTVEEWIFDEGERELLAVRFNLSGGEEYIIEAKNLLIYSHGRTGLDYEGLSPIRPVAAYIEIKQELMQLMAHGAELNANGFKYIKWDTGTLDNGNAAAVVSSLGSAKAMSNSVTSLPEGADLGWLTNNAASLQAEIRYCDEMISQPLTAQGSLLGLNTHGSFALADSKKSDNASAASYYASRVSEMMNMKNSIIQLMVDFAFGPQDHYPRLKFSLQKQVGVDAERLEQILSAVNAGMPMDNERWNKVGEDFGFAPMGEQEEVEANQEEVVFSHVGCNHQKKKITHEEESFTLAGLPNKEAVQAYWEASETRIAKLLAKSSKVIRGEYTTLAAPVTNPRQLEIIKNTVINRHMPLLKEDIKPSIRQAVLKGGATLLVELGVMKKLPTIKGNVSSLNKKGLEDWVDYESSRISSNVLNVLLSRLEGQAVRELGEGVPIRKLPEIPTLSAIKRTVGAYLGRSFNQGREGVVETLIVEAANRGLPTIMLAEYSSVLEKTTCGPCRAADGTRVTVGSKKYNKLSPPNVCDGRDRCRCIWSYASPGSSDYDEMLKDITKGFAKADSVLLSHMDGSFVDIIKYNID